MNYDDVKKFEAKLQEETNIILKHQEPLSVADNLSLADEFDSPSNSHSNSPSAITPSTPDQSTARKGYLSSWWS